MALLYDLIEIGILNYDDMKQIVCLPEPFFCIKKVAMPPMTVCNPPSLSMIAVITFKAAFPPSTNALNIFEFKVVVENSWNEALMRSKLYSIFLLTIIATYCIVVFYNLIYTSIYIHKSILVFHLKLF